MKPNVYPEIFSSSEHGSRALLVLERRSEMVLIRRGRFREPLEIEKKHERERQELLARCCAVAADMDSTFAFSHTTAGALRRWPAPIDPAFVEIVQRTKQTRSGRGDVRRHHRPELTESDIVWIDGLPVTTETRTVLDNACALSPCSALVLVDGALAQLAEMDPFKREESLAREAAVRAEWVAALTDRGAARGVRQAREVLRYANGFSGSPGESRTRWLGLTAGLPEPVCQWEVWVDGRRYFSDAAWLQAAPDWPHRAITFEYDGVDKYGLTAAQAVAVVAQEKEREDAIRSTDAAVHRVTKERLSSMPRARAWMLSKFPPSSLAELTPRPLLMGGPALRRPSR